MADFTPPTTKSFDLPSSSMLGNGSPKSVYLFFLLGLCKSFFDMMIASHDSLDIDAGTSTLISFCPSEDKQEELWKFYVEEKAKSDGSYLYASVKTIGKLIAYLSETLEFTEESTGGLL